MARSALARRRRRRGIWITVVVVAVGAAGSAAYGLTRPSGPDYRTAAVSSGTVAQTVETTGTVSTVNQATVSFPVAGTVNDVAVGLGSTVTAGQTLATLQTASLDQAVSNATDTVASAQQTLARDEADQTATASTTTESTGAATDDAAVRPLGGFTAARPTPTATPTPAPTANPTPAPGKNPTRSPAPGTGGSTSVTALLAKVKQLQQVVVHDQHTVDLDAAVAAADQAVARETATCAAVLADGTTPTPTVTPTSTGTAPPTAAPTTTAAPTVTSTPTAPTTSPDPVADLTACQQAIAVVEAAQDSVRTGIDLLSQDESALDAAVSDLVTALGKTTTGKTTTGTGTSRTPTTGTGSTRTGSTGTGSSTGTQSANRTATAAVITAAQLAADQKQIDAAAAQLAVAQQDRSAAVLAAPISGRVGALSISAGQVVSGGSTTASVTILGSGAKAVSTTIGIADVDLVKPNDPVQITVDGVTQVLSGHVSYIGILNTSGTSGTTTTYPVTVVLDPTPLTLFDGAGASLAISVGSATNVLTVPVSALHQTGALSTVDVLTGSTVSAHRVTVGVEGTDRVQILSGLTAGQRVVLANVGAAVPTNSTNNRFGGGGLGVGTARLGTITGR